MDVRKQLTVAYEDGYRTCLKDLGEQLTRDLTTFNMNKTEGWIEVVNNTILFNFYKTLEFAPERFNAGNSILVLFTQKTKEVIN